MLRNRFLKSCEAGHIGCVGWADDIVTSVSYTLLICGVQPAKHLHSERQAADHSPSVAETSCFLFWPWGWECWDPLGTEGEGGGGSGKGEGGKGVRKFEHIALRAELRIEDDFLEMIS